MDSEMVSERIELLVDRLRADKSATSTLSDVAAVTEVLLTIMRRYFNSIDVSIYGELRHLYEHIQEARSEIAHLRPNDLKEDKIPRAGAELEAIVQATEQATGTIMDAAEEIMSADNSDAEAYAEAVNDACMRIFEACSFQDITGQRITKVVDTLTHIEDRLSRLQKAWGHEDGEAPARDANDDVGDGEVDEEAELLNGPALEGEGIAQDMVDSLLAGDGAEPIDVDAADDAGDTTDAVDTEAGTDSIDAGANDNAAAADQDDGAAASAADVTEVNGTADDETEAAAKKEKKVSKKKETAAAADDDALAASGGEAFSQEDIDALFD